MFPSNLHTHTTHSDGSHPPEAYIQTAIANKFVSIGFSDHQPTIYKSTSEMQENQIPIYIEDINRLKKKYEGTIEVALGIEADIYGTSDPAHLNLDYVIGAVHYLKKADGTYGSIDASPEHFIELIDAFNGIENLAEEYYARLTDIINRKPDILAHFDLIAKFNSESKFFDPEESWHKQLIHEVIGHLTTTNIIVEVNTGAIARGYSKTPYPHKYILRNLAKKGIPITISADAHTPGNLCHAFNDALELIKSTEHKTVMVYQDTGFKEVSLKNL